MFVIVYITFLPVLVFTYAQYTYTFSPWKSKRVPSISVVSWRQGGGCRTIDLFLWPDRQTDVLAWTIRQDINDNLCWNDGNCC